MRTSNNLKQLKMEITLKTIAEILGINSQKSIKIEGLDYFYYNSKEAVDSAIVVYYKKNEHRYTYLNASHFMDDHGLQNVNELKAIK